MDPDKVALISQIAPVIAIVGVAGMAGWVITTWMRIKNGYPLDGAWGQAVYPKNNKDEMGRLEQLAQENTQIKAELSKVKERLANMERIVVDGNHSLSEEIEALRNLDVKSKDKVDV
ncbi:hypothetical protein LPB140_07530 [Sphingorhabdus lutea]|uniref:Uncharacterized protein n=1 Tax=Sphingorhabdus lutea TaxID=1913578 RepID=A0A1L3JC74_9SPHN|nr:hypothetical protein [Sphingorhabdus lutea]APG62663.1 hypothetical protein LPB140_07530 [Sphingorhabdus lutea]